VGRPTSPRRCRRPWRVRPRLTTRPSPVAAHSIADAIIRHRGSPARPRHRASNSALGCFTAKPGRLGLLQSTLYSAAIPPTASPHAARGFLETPVHAPLATGCSQLSLLQSPPHAARRFLEKPVHLFLTVRAKKGWTEESRSMYEKMGLDFNA
jgi:hypothetical protein